MLAWNARLSLPRIAWESDPIACTLADRFFDPTGLRYGVVSGSMFLDVPVAIAVVHGAPGSGAALAVGAGCAARPARRVAQGALRELRRLSVARLGHGRRGRPPSPAAASRSQTFDDHMLFYARDEEARLAGVPRRVAGDLRPRRPPATRGIDTRGAPRRARGAARPAAASAPTRSTSRHRTCARLGLARRARAGPRAVPAGRLAHRALPRGRAALHRAPRRRPRAATSPTRRRQPASSSVPVIDPAARRARREARRGEVVPTVRMTHLLGIDHLSSPDPTEDYHEASRVYPGIVDPRVGGAAQLERSVEMRISVARSVKRHPGRPFQPLPEPRLANAALGESLALRRSQPRLRRPRAPARRARDRPPCCLRRHGSPDRHGTGAPYGPVGRRALSARAVRRMQPRRRDRPGPLPLRPAPTRAGAPPPHLARRARRAEPVRRGARVVRRGPARHGRLLAVAVQVRRPRVPVHAAGGRSRRAERRARRHRARPRLGADRWLLRPSRRRVPRDRRAPRGVALPVPARGRSAR